MYVRVGPQRRLSTKELMLLNCGAGEDSWIASRSNQSLLKEINPEYSLEGLLQNLRLQYFGHLMRRADNSLEKTLMLGKVEGRRRRGQQRTRWLDDVINSDMSLSKLQELVMDKGGLVCCDSWGRKELDTTERLI